ncbi:lanthionine synthetase C family protein [Streptomyces heilongjiangensis]|uniref:Lanthionine synthetase C family protein n=1 Tax=Streptomyces heilongjiangensis TaxID=945052 RepID=A0ABW1BAG5_9ACTN|nr:lanthionine synthetase C family protein [Streptomyces heilongjiangensis]MDC2950004.1 lanthionine synthetase C family protein [Streptomyces heilongjiangensis]
MNDLVHDLGRGLAGTVLYQAVLAQDSGQWDTVHTTARALVRQPAAVHPAGASLYRGAPAVAYVLHAAGHPAYRSALGDLDSVLAVFIRTRLADAHRRMEAGHPPRMQEYDLISGLTGLGALLLRRGTHSELLDDVLHYLVRLLQQPIMFHGEEVPGWWTSDSPSGRPDAAWPTGHGNFGMAHGVAGPIALLALSARAGHSVAGQHQALIHCCRLLEERAHHLPNGATAWPETLTIDGWIDRSTMPRRPGRPSWCYGTPGIARALQLAAIACSRTATQRLAEDALTTCAADPEQLGRIDNATVCHGWAGLCLAVDRAAADTAPDGALRRVLSRLRSRFATHVAQHALPGTAGVLTGGDGILLTLHTLNPARPVATGWETCLLLN